MIRRFIPHISAGRWGGATLSDPLSMTAEARGFCIAIEWLGVLIEIGAGRVRR